VERAEDGEDGERSEEMFDWLKAHSRLLDVKRVQSAIAGAEERTSAEIRVSVSPFFWGNVYRAAERAFERLGMRGTLRRNGVLFFIVPSRRAFVVLGDAGIHAHVEHGFWAQVVDEMRPYFAHRDFTSGVLVGITKVADELTRHFPVDPEANPNELSDSVDLPR
jgi:uncharacterized membrane protein